MGSAMKALAEFIMAGRFKAALVAFFGNLLPLISPAAVGLVALRRSVADATLVMLWALLPLIVLLNTSDVSALMIWASLLSVSVVVLGALTLRSTTSWAWALLAMVLASAVASLLARLNLAAELEAMRASILEVFAELAKQQEQVIDLVPSDVFLSGLIAWAVALTAITALLLARWWQALLYNPGGFRSEFHGLRMNRGVAVMLMAGLSFCYLLSGDYFPWGNLLGLPLLLSGIALVHHTVAFAQFGSHWLVVFYMSLVLMVGPLSTVLVGLGFLDSLLDFRTRLAARKGSQ